MEAILKWKWRLMIAGLCLGILWNMLCLVGTLPFGIWPVNFLIVFIGNAAILLPYCFPARFPKQENSKETSKSERISSLSAVSLYAAWVVTVFACGVYLQ